MGVEVAERRMSAHVTRLGSATALACLMACGALALQAQAQDIAELAGTVPDNAQMLLEADTLVYDNDLDVVTAVGGVQIEYGGNRLVADKVSYNRKTGRLTASGGVEIINSDGTVVSADEVDITDDFGDGFINALRVETVNKTYFAAESARRQTGTVTTFNNGVYTACAPCEDDPDRAPIWRFKSRKIIWNGKEKIVRFEHARFELLGLPIAYLPVFEIPDPTVKRKSGFLTPSLRYESELGAGLRVPYYLALSPTYDLTLTGTGYTSQGFLGEAEWRQRFNNGQYSVTIAGISQANPEEFAIGAGGFTEDSGPDGDPNELRGMIGTQGRFDLNPRWSYGWDLLLQSDRNFSLTYGIPGYNQYVHRSQIYLTGLDDRNYFDLRAMHFDVQENILKTNPGQRQDKQPDVLPVLDYSFTPDSPVFGGELNFDLNARVLRRRELDLVYSAGNGLAERILGVEGTNSRITAEAEWKRSVITQGGLVVTPLLAFQTDATGVEMSNASVQAINEMATNPDIDAETDTRSAYYRFMATAGLELRWPVLFSSTSSTHVLEPMAQVFARPSETYASTLDIPNEDAQSFVFDASSLFERDKFSGYDRIEGGTRANVGLRYSGSYDNGWTTNALAGQSFQLAGDNSFASPDLVNVGAYSGLETDTSDFVGLVGFTAPFGLAASASARIDEESLELRRAETKALYGAGPLLVSAKYAFIQKQPLYGFPNDRRELTLAGSARVSENWSAFGSGTYDFESEVVVTNTLGFSYDDECFALALSWATTRDGVPQTTDIQSVGFNLSFRTIGDFGSSTNLANP